MAKAKSEDVRIVVLQRGWVAVGRYSREGSQVLLENASIIRLWGTTKGLGELRAGPLSKTVLDKAGEIEAHQLAVVLTIKCDAKGWAEHVAA